VNCLSTDGLDPTAVGKLAVSFDVRVKTVAGALQDGSSLITKLLRTSRRNPHMPNPTPDLTPLSLQERAVRCSTALNHVLDLLLSRREYIPLSGLKDILGSITIFTAVLQELLTYQPNTILSKSVEAFTLQAEILESLIIHQQLTTLHNFTQDDGTKPN
jgi:hypothetical protein